MIPRTSDDLRPRPAYPRSIFRSIVHLFSPCARVFVNEPLAEWMHQMHPLRMQYEIFSDQNPFMAPVRALAQMVRDDRKAVAADNPFVAIQEQISRQVVASLDAARDMSENISERIFLSFYGSPMLQAAVGVDPVATHPLRKAPHSPLASSVAASADWRTEVKYRQRRSARRHVYAPCYMSE